MPYSNYLTVEGADGKRIWQSPLALTQIYFSKWFMWNFFFPLTQGSCHLIYHSTVQFGQNLNRFHKKKTWDLTLNKSMAVKSIPKTRKLTLHLIKFQSLQEPEGKSYTPLSLYEFQILRNYFIPPHRTNGPVLQSFFFWWWLFQWKITKTIFFNFF